MDFMRMFPNWQNALFSCLKTQSYTQKRTLKKITKATSQSVEEIVITRYALSSEPSICTDAQSHLYTVFIMFPIISCPQSIFSTL